MRKLIIALGAASLILAMPAWAQDDDEEDEEGGGGFDRPGFYGSISAMYAVENISDQKVRFGDEKTTTGFDDAWGGNFRLGYRVNEVLGVEFEWEGFQEFSDSKGTQVDIKGWLGTLNARAHIPLGRIQPFLLIGGGLMQTRTNGPNSSSLTEESAVIRGGGGVDAYITENIVFTTDVTYVVPFYDNRDIDYVSISFGLGYRF